MRVKGRAACVLAILFGLAAVGVGLAERTAPALTVALAGLVAIVFGALASPKGDRSPRLGVATAAWALCAVWILAVALYRGTGSDQFAARAFGVGVLLAIVPMGRAFAWRRVYAPTE